jgi:hypothetical protein
VVTKSGLCQLYEIHTRALIGYTVGVKLLVRFCIHVKHSAGLV